MNQSLFPEPHNRCYYHPHFIDEAAQTQFKPRAIVIPTKCYDQDLNPSKHGSRTPSLKYYFLFIFREKPQIPRNTRKALQEWPLDWVLEDDCQETQN